MSSAEAGDARLRPALLAAISLILAAPFLVVRDVPFLDLPEHIARQHILYDPAIAAAVAEHYRVHWQILPNLAIDLFVGLFRFVMPIDWAVRLFLAVTAVQLFLGAVAVNRALHGRGARFGGYAALLVFSGPFEIGLVNVTFGIGLALWVFALSLVLKRFWLRFALCGALAVAILFSHLYALALFGLLVGTHAFGRALGERRGLAAGIRTIGEAVAPLAVPVAFYLAFVPRGFTQSVAADWGIGTKIYGLLSLLGLYNPAFDLGCLVLILYGAAIAWRQLVLAPPMRWALLALALAFVVLPSHVQAALFDLRIPATFALVLVASVDWRPRAPLRAGFDRVVLALFAVRMGVMVAQWLTWQPIYAEFRSAFTELAPGAKLLALNTHPADLPFGDHPSVAHVEALAVAERGVFIPTMFAGAPHDILFLSDRASQFLAASGSDPKIADYDDVVVFDPGPDGPPAGTEAIVRGSRFILAKVVH